MIQESSRGSKEPSLDENPTLAICGPWDFEHAMVGCMVRLWWSSRPRRLIPTRTNRPHSPNSPGKQPRTADAAPSQKVTGGEILERRVRAPEWEETTERSRRRDIEAGAGGPGPTAGLRGRGETRGQGKQSPEARRRSRTAKRRTRDGLDSKGARRPSGIAERATAATGAHCARDGPVAAPRPFPLHSLHPHRPIQDRQQPKPPPPLLQHPAQPIHGTARHAPPGAPPGPHSMSPGCTTARSPSRSTPTHNPPGPKPQVQRSEPRRSMQHQGRDSYQEPLP